MDKRRKRGNDFQDWVADWLKKRGWSVYNQKTVCHAIPVKGKILWGVKHQDIFGCDLIAIKLGDSTLFIQATLDSSVTKRLEELKKYGWDFHHQRVMLWQKRKPGPVVLRLFNGEQFLDVGKIIRGKFDGSPNFFGGVNV